MVFDILTLFPDFFSSPLSQSIIGKAISKGVLKVNAHNLRDYTEDRHRTTDDYPYGGGHGMVMKAEPVVKAVEALRKEAGPSCKVILTTPQGRKFTQETAKELSGTGRLIIVCGRYEGYDERIRAFADLELSIGDYILTGGEIPALVIIDSVARLIPGVLGEYGSAESDSFSDGLLEYPQYTRPEEFRDMRVPDVLLSGNHAEIERWRREESIKKTFERRPELLDSADLTKDERRLIERLSAEKTGRQ